jgi:hypothetical protein
MPNGKFGAIAGMRAGVKTQPVAAPPMSKKSNPEWKSFTFFLRIAARRDAARRLFDLNDGRDFSDLMQELLEKWLKEK